MRIKNDLLKKLFLDTFERARAHLDLAKQKGTGKIRAGQSASQGHQIHLVSLPPTLVRFFDRVIITKTMGAPKSASWVFDGRSIRLTF